MWNFPHNTNPEDVFFRVATQVYGQDPNWIPESAPSIRWQFSQENPYYREIQTHIWGIDEECRIAGFYNPHLRIQGKKVAFFGYWETIENIEQNQFLFSLFEQWAQKCGAQKCYGPICFTTYGSYRIQLPNNPRKRPFWGEPYNPSYYERLLTSCGYEMFQDYVSIIGNERHLPIYRKVSTILEKELHTHRLRPVALTPDLWMERQQEIHSIFQSLWEDNFGFVPIDFPTFTRFFSRQTAEMLDPECSIALLDKDNAIAGYLAVYPDYAPLLIQGSTTPIPPQSVHYANAFHKLKNPELLVKTGCIHPKYRQHKLFTAMSVLACSQSMEKGYSIPLGCLIRSDNHPRKMADVAQRVDPEATAITQYYGLFSKVLR